MAEANDHPIFPLSSTLADELAGLYPEWATYIGIEGHDALWSDLSPDGADRQRAELASMSARVDELPVTTNQWDRLAVLAAEVLLADLAEPVDHDDHLRDLDSIASPVQNLRDVFDHMRKETAEHWESVILRLEGLPAALGGYTRALGAGLERGLAVARRQVKAVATQTAKHASDTSALIGLMAEFDSGAAVHPGLRDRLDAAIGTGRAAFGALNEFLTAEYLPRATDRDAVGEERYLRAARSFLGTTIEPEDTYRWGWQQVAEIRSRMERVASRITDGGIPAALTALKSDPRRQAADHAAFQLFVQERLDEALNRLADVHFDVPKAIHAVDVKIAPVGGPLGAYYVGPSEDFQRPGRVWFSLGDDGTVPLYDQVTTAYHEGFPGHHLQVGVQISLADRLSRLHRLWVWKAGTGEGWALYAERLMDELGFLDTPDYEFGMLGAQMLRACRVVIDIGTHLDWAIPSDQPFRSGERWTFDSAVEMLTDYATLDEKNARSEVTRYFGWPGQAIAYKVGERAILDIRETTKHRLGKDFDLKQFHADLLGIGPVGIDLVREMMQSGV